MITMVRMMMIIEKTWAVKIGSDWQSQSKLFYHVLYISAIERYDQIIFSLSVVSGYVKRWKKKNIASRLYIFSSLSSLPLSLPIFKF